MPQQFYEATAGTFLLVVVTLFLLDFGVLPFTATAENLRIIIQKHRIRLLRLFGFIAFFLFLSCIWFILYLSDFPYMPLPERARMLGGIIIIIDLLLSIILWLIYMNKPPIRWVSTSIRKSLLSQFSRGKGLKSTLLKDLVYIGICGDGDHEKHYIIEQLGKLAESVQKDKPPYKGDNLVLVLRSFDRILTNPMKPGNDLNYSAAAGVIRNILEKSNDSTLATAADYNTGLETLRRLAVEASLTMSSETFNKYLELAASHSNILFDIGAATYAAGRFDRSRKALSKLEALAARAPGLDLNENTANLLGLLAYFDASPSQSMKEVAESYIASNKLNFRPSYKECRQFAIDYHLDLLHYDTVDKISALPAS
ncbi:MAG: hypothetical protein NT002_13665 [candidate division Zixibacteria bacterium]|nr:hypothetical protein [candidate division Zixibacteria bacterium]